MSTKKYFYLYLILLGTAASLLAVFNAIVDPYLIFRSDRVPGFNEKKPASVNRSQLFKPYDVLRVKPRTIVVGNSRPEMGLDPLSACWLDEHGTVYSLTFPGLSAYGQVRALFHGVASEKVKHVVLGLDFADVLYKTEAPVDEVIWPVRHSEFFDRLLVDEQFQHNPGRWTNKAKDVFMALFSLDALYDSLNTIVFQSPNSPDRTSLGFNPARDYIEIVRHEGEWVLFSQKLGELKSRFSKATMGIFNTFDRWSVELEGLKKTIEYTAQYDIQLTLFINPYHYIYLESIRDSGYWNEFEDFKRSLKQLVDQYGGGQVELWDFSLYSPYTVSAVPKKGDKRTSTWFWEPAHYKAELGDVMLEEMFGKQCISERQASSLGVHLNDIDIEVHFHNQRSQRTVLINNLVAAE